MTKIFLIRHGVTVWNKQRRYCGCKDVGLSRQGKAQVIKLRSRFKDLNFDRIYCSGKRRALETKAILFGNCGFRKVNGLREINFGVLEGLRHEEVIVKYPVVYKKWIADPYRERIPKAERMHLFKKRVLSTIKKIFEINRGKTVAVVCHGGVIGVLVSNILKKDKEFWKYVPSSASITIIEQKNNKFKIKKFNDRKHLKK